MKAPTLGIVLLLLVGWTSSSAFAADTNDFPPGWLPVHRLDDAPAWSDFRKIDDKVQLYLPPGVENCRGVFVCFVFHSADPRELARLWKFALVTVPWPFEFDLGHNDKRNGRFKIGHAAGDMGLLLRYLDAAAKETGHPELAVCPLVGWLGQNGSHLCADLHERAPSRVLAWCDSFPNRLRQYPELTKAIPFPFAWEISKNELKSQTRVLKQSEEPLADLSCRANTYGFDHGIYSKFNFFMAYLDRCIRLRMSDELPPPGQPVPLKPVVRASGWVGDFQPISEWSPIAPADSKEAGQMQYPAWLPDEYAAWMWRSYHSANPNLKLTAPAIEYRKKDGKWGGPECGLGYGGQVKSDQPLRFAAETTGSYVKLQFHDGDQVLGEATASPWQVDNIELTPGLHALFVVGITAEGTRRASRPAFLIVE
jgi:hypothetical protein